MCSAVAQVLRPHVAFNQRLDTFCVPDTGDQGVRCDPVCGGRTGCRKGNRARGALPWLESNYTLSSLSSPDAVVLCFAGGANDSLGLCDCCWGFPGLSGLWPAGVPGEAVRGPARGSSAAVRTLVTFPSVMCSLLLC